MKIGFDARWYFEGNISNRIVVRNLLDILLRSSKHEIVPILRKKDYLKSKKIFPKSNPIFCSISNPLLSNYFEIPFLKRANEMDIIITQNFSPIFGKFKKVNYVHDIIFEDYPEFFTFVEKIYFKLMYFSSKKSDLVITISKNEKQRLKKYNYSKNIEYIYHGVDYELTKHSGDSSIKDKLPNQYLLTVGRLNDRKNLGNTIKAFEKINDSNFFLIVIGEKSWKFKELKINDSIKNRIIFMQNLSPHDLSTIYRNAYASIFLSLEEGFGLPILESMYFGLPVILSNCSVMPEISGDAGIKVNPFNIQEISSAMNRIINDKEMFKDQQNLSLTRSKFFSWKSSVDKIVYHCEKLIVNKNDS